MESLLLFCADLSETAYCKDDEALDMTSRCQAQGVVLSERIWKTLNEVDTHCFTATTMVNPLTGTMTLFISFRGTADLKNLLTDADAKLCACPFAFKNIAVHRGFSDAYAVVQDMVWAEIRKFLHAYSNGKIIVTGHSLGGALATLCGLDIALRLTDALPLQVRTFGSPRVGTAAFVKLYNKMVPDTVRAVHDDDLIPQVPIGEYRHVAGEFRFTDDGHKISAIRCWWNRLLKETEQVVEDLDGEALKEHGIARYIAALRKVA